jgi:chromosome segregation ATPase
MTELRNHLKWLDEERRKTARKLGEMEQRIAQQGRDISEREKRIHELEWQLAQVSERIEQMPEMGSGSSGQEQRLQDLEWHMSNINAQLVRLPKLDDELASFREQLSQYTVDIENRLLSQQADTAQRLENDVYARLRDDIAQSIVTYNERLAGISTDVSDRLVTTEASIANQFGALKANFADQIDAKIEAALQSVPTVSSDRVVEIETTVQANDQRLAEFLSMAQAIQQRQAQLETALAGLDLDQGMRAALDKVEQELEMRQAEEIRLANLIGVQESKFERANDQIEEMNRVVAQMQIQSSDRVVEIETTVQANDQRLAEFLTMTQAIQQRQAQLETALAGLDLDQGVRAALDKVEQELEMRQAEEIRLANLIGVQESKFEHANDRIEEMNQVVAQMQSQAAMSDEAIVELRGWYRDLNDNWKPALMEASGKLVPLSDRLTVLSTMVTKTDATVQTLAADQAEMRDGIVDVSDEVRQARQDLAHQIDTWQTTIDEHKETVERFTQQWLTLSNQYKEARMAVQNFAHWQKQLEQQKREASEMLRVESNRMQSRWEGFLLEIQEQLKNADLDLAQKWQTFEMENEQRWVAARRSEQLWREELANVDELIVKLQQDNRNLIWRVQAAQADAIKKWPRLLLEEVEKAVELNPNRRLQSTPGAAARSDMSVVDAIEQGLIKVDYDDGVSDSAS